MGLMEEEHGNAIIVSFDRCTTKRLLQCASCLEEGLQFAAGAQTCSIVPATDKLATLNGVVQQLITVQTLCTYDKHTGYTAASSDGE